MLNEFAKELNKTLEQYKVMYKQSMKQAEDHLLTLPKDKQEDFKELLNEVKEATKELDTNKLRALIYKVKNKR